MKPAAALALVVVIAIVVGGIGYGVYSKGGNNPSSSQGCQGGYVENNGACCPSGAPYYDPATNYCYRQPVGSSTSVSNSMQSSSSFNVTDNVSFNQGSGFNGFAIYTSSYNYLLTMGWGGACGGPTFVIQDVHGSQLYSGTLVVTEGYFQGGASDVLIYTVEKNQGAASSIVITEQDSLGRTLAVGSVSIPTSYQQTVLSDKTGDYAGQCATPT